MAGEKIYYADSLNEAISMALMFKEDGKYDLFRGQTYEHWDPSSSLVRLYGDSEAMEVAQLKHHGFFNWLDQHQSLNYLGREENTDKAFGILQHYGVPTTLLDFTTSPEIAGFFSADTNQIPPQGTTSVLFCLASKDLLSLWSTLSKLKEREGCILYFIDEHIENLWRLETQKGVFLRANFNWCYDYPMDRILFPYSGYPEIPLKNEIYPLRKSALELELDQYFDITRSFVNLRELRRRNFFKLGETFEIEYPDNYYYKKYFTRELLQVWPESVISTWQNVANESYYESKGDVIIANLDELGKAFLNLNRNKTYDFQAENGENEMNEKIGSALGKLWDGMRNLPFTTDQIVKCAKNCSALFRHKVDGSGNSYTERKRFADALGVNDTLVLEIGTEMFALNVLASSVQVRDVLHADFIDSLKIEYKEKDPSLLLQICYNAPIMLDFERFVELYAEQLIPSQLIGPEPYIEYNPSKVKLFGFK